MIQFSKLRLSGFKSFVDKTEMDIGPGLNGIVGPNGCGKSNLVEALRWVMGENSAKRMRGDGMEDVIFAGTDKRSPRNFAEVSLLLDNSKRLAPATYNSSDDIEVTRKIERDKGSAYRVNGKLVRARDVQMLFADTVTGANSPSLVSQGHVTRMINAKPQDRRLILEESAGIAGLYARRHEAELRLKAADTNLVRLEDITSSMETRLNGLKRQARQALKYKNLSAQLRQMDLLITCLEWRELTDKKKDVEQQFSSAESDVAQNLITVTQLNKTYNTQFENLPELRKEETRLSAELQKKKLEFERVSDAIKRLDQDREQTNEQRNQTEGDLQREFKNKEELEESSAKTQQEHDALLNAEQGQEDKLARYDQEKESAAEKVKELEERYNALKDDAAERRARTDSLKKQIEQNQSRLETLENRKDSLEKRKNELSAERPEKKAYEALKEKQDAINKKLDKLKSKTDTVKETIKKADEQLENARKEKNLSQQKLTEAKSEHATLEQFFQQTETQNTNPALDEITTKQGYERALSRAMGDSLLASLDKNASEQWTDQHTKEQLPKPIKGTIALKDVVKAPENLGQALSQIQVLENEEDIDKAITSIKPGQSIVTKSGEYWRWDGYHIKADATDRHAVYLEQKNKYQELHKNIEGMENALKQTSDKFDAALKQKQNAQELYESLLEKISSTESEINSITPQIQKHKEQTIRFESEKERLTQQDTEICEDIESLKATLKNDEALYAELKTDFHDQDKAQAKIDAAKIELDKARTEYQNSIRTYDLFIQEQSTRKARIQAVADERINLKNRLIRSNQQISSLQERLTSLNDKIKELEKTPEINLKNSPKKEQDRLEEIHLLEKAKSAASEKLAACENDVAETSKALKQAEETLSNAKEKRAAAQAMLSALNEQNETMDRNVEEKFSLKPSELSAHISVDLVNYNAADLPNLRKQKEKLTRDRDVIGAVNLRAEEEMIELEKELTTLLHERNDLVQAIEELRGGINKINKEARERLLVAFDHVNAHFQKLFVRLFSGGKAHLELIDAEDPLGAGLEIFAQPPGKSLQSLSLLSGGEQTLASIALIFAMFLTNPSPICVLDEIDAPLDDANVDKVCDLLEEISERVETRFVIITHHRLSMARMDRLYGVTMSEKGVSQLISVDLQQSFSFIDKQTAA